MKKIPHIFIQSISFNMIRLFLTYLGYPKVLGKTHTHCQIVAQLKLRTTKSTKIILSRICYMSKTLST